MKEYHKIDGLYKRDDTMTNEKLEIVLGTILANTMLILQNLDYDLETPVETLEEIEIAVDTSEQVLAMLTDGMIGDTE